METMEREQIRICISVAFLFFSFVDSVVDLQYIIVKS